jgi:uncharacterized protein YbjT (DUF2867 family)
VTVIAIMGAAGHVASKVCELLLEAGEKVRVMEHTRDLGHLRQRGAEVIAGDASSVEALRALFASASAALVLLPEDVSDPSFVENRVAMSRAIRDALRAEGVSHVVALSAVGADSADAAGPPAGLHIFERDLGELEGLNLLVIRSAMYMDYLLAPLPMIKAEKVNGSATKADVRFPMVATIDVAREAADHLRKRDFTGHQVKVLLGPEDVSMSEATGAIGMRLGIPELPYVEFPPDAVRGALQQAGMSEEAAGLIVDLQLALNDGRKFEGVQRTTESTTLTRLDDFLDGALAKEE